MALEATHAVANGSDTEHAPSEQRR